jgi:hypothetical protein
MRWLAYLVTSFGVAAVLALILVLTVGELQAPIKQLVYFAIAVVAIVAGHAAKTSVEKGRAQK